MRHLRSLFATVVLTALLALIAPAIFPSGAANAASNRRVTALVNVNIRSGPGTDHERIGLLAGGTSIQARGEAKDGWVPVTYGDREGWVSQAYVSGSSKAPSAGGSAGEAWTTTRLNVRPSASTAESPLTVLDEGAKVATTGTTSGRWTQISWDESTAWVATRYLASSPKGSDPEPTPAPTPTPEPAPTPSGTRWASAELNLWTSATGGQHSGTVPAGTELGITGNVASGRAEVVWKGSVRWVTARYLSDTAPSSGQVQTCKASFYGDDTATASGDPFDQWAMKVAHKTLPFGTRLKVTNPSNGKSVVVTVNDRGPYVAGRCLDLTTGAFAQIASTSQGVIEVDFVVLS